MCLWVFLAEGDLRFEPNSGLSVRGEAAAATRREGASPLSRKGRKNLFLCGIV